MSETESTEEAITLGTTDDGAEYNLPIRDVLTGRGFITGKSGSGKSNTASVIAEELLDRGYPLLIVDTDGEYYGLKQEYELLHAGGDDECDIQVGPEHAEKLAGLALDQNVPIILDVSGYIDTDTSRALIRDVAQHLFAKGKKLKKPFLLIVEEIHEYIPEGKGMDDTGEMLVQVGKRGRKHGLGLVGVSQRPADVKKDFITQANWMAWHRLTWQNDTKVVSNVVGGDAADRVTDLADGQAIFQVDFIDADRETVQVRRKHTFDAGATPDLDDFERPELKSVSDDLVDELSDISDQRSQRQDEVERLKAKLDEKDDEIAELESELETARNVSAAASRMAEAIQEGAAGEGEAGGVPEDFKDQIEAKNERISELERAVEEKDERVDELEAAVERAQLDRERVEQAEEIEASFEEAAEHVEALGAALDANVSLSRPAAGAGDGDETADERVEELREENERLRERLEEAGDYSMPSDYADFYHDDDVQEAIEDAKEESSAYAKCFSMTMSTIVAEGGPVTYEEIAETMGVATTSDISKAASSLVAVGVLKKTQENPTRVDFNMDGLQEIKRKKRKRREAERIAEGM